MPKLSASAQALFLIMILPFFGYFLEGEITISSCLASLVAFGLLVHKFFIREV